MKPIMSGFFEQRKPIDIKSYRMFIGKQLEGAF